MILSKLIWRFSLVSSVIVVPSVIPFGAFPKVFSTNDEPIDYILEQTVVPDQEFLNDELFDRNSVVNNEKLSYLTSNPKLPDKDFIAYDSQILDSSLPTNRDSTGMRFGGGLFFDDETNWTGDVEQIENTGADLENNVLSTFNYVSSDTDKVIQKDDQKANDNISSWIASDEERLKYPLATSVEGTKGNVNFQDINIAPESNTKNIFKALFNIELNSWYWETWRAYYDDIYVSEQNYSIAQESINYLLNNSDNSLLNTPRINLSLAWSQLIAEEKQLPAWAEAGKSLLNVGVGTLLGMIPGVGVPLALMTALAGEAFSSSLPKSYLTYDYKQNLINYYTPRLTQKFWSNYFNEYLGKPGGSGLINEYLKKYGILPSEILINNFDINISNLGLSGIWKNAIAHYSRMDKNYNDSSASIDLSGLKIDMPIDFTLSRNVEPPKDALNQLKNIGPLALDRNLINKDNLIASDPKNIEAIKTEIKSNDPALFDELVRHLTFTGKLDPYEYNSIKVFYDGKVQDFTLEIGIA